jgi:hypothetical protein
MYGFTRSELMRTGAINYCQQLLLTSALENFSDLSASVRKRCDNNDMSEETLSQFAQLEKLVQDMKKHLGID